MMGREEAESETRRLKEEKRALKQELEDGRAKERKVAERVETIMVSLINYRVA
jgi:seryl-tRNA synthetase